MDHRMPALLTARGITKRFPGVTALDSVDFDLNKGEVHALVGENGAGKSTLMQILAGIQKREGGVVSVEGVECEPAGKHAAEKAGIRIVFQDSSLFPDLTVEYQVRRRPWHLPGAGEDRNRLHRCDHGIRGRVREGTEEAPGVIVRNPTARDASVASEDLA